MSDGSPTLTRWWWVRHAPAKNPNKLIYGQTDIAAEFPNQRDLQAMADMLPEKAVWVTSGLDRAVQTADRLLALMNDIPAAPLLEPNFSEQSFGDWEGLAWDDVPSDQSKSFWRDPANITPPNGESFRDLTDRVGVAIMQFANEHRGRDIVVVGHAGSIRAALMMALKVPIEASLTLRLDPLRVTHIDQIEADGGVNWCVHCVNCA